MLDEIQNTFAHFQTQMHQTILLQKPEVISAHIDASVVSSTIAFCVEVLDESNLVQTRTKYLRKKVEKLEWHGLDSNNVLVGYFSKTNTGLSFSTENATVFNENFENIIVTMHDIGLLIRVSGKTYAVGRFMTINDSLAPLNISHPALRDVDMWYEDFAATSIIDPTLLKTQRSKDRIILYVWAILFFGGGSAAIILAIQ